MSRFWSPVVRQLTPYVAGEQPKLPGLIKLNTNEHPYGPAPQVLAAVAQAATDQLRLYPDPDAQALRQQVAAHHGVLPGQVFMGNGSDEVLAHAFQAFFQQDLPVLMPDITYSFYQVYCRLYGIAFKPVPVNSGFEIDIGDYAQACGGVVLANPNAPTGIGLPQARIEALLRLQPERVVLVDEAYVDFGGESAVSLLGRHPNLLVVQTLSKSRALAGLRVGYAIGSRELIEGLQRVKDSFNSYPLDRVAQAAAGASFVADAYFRQCCEKVMQTRDALTQGLRSLGFEVLPSQANFVFARHPGHDGAALAARLRERAILVRHFKSPRIDAFLRITVGTPDQVEALLAALRGLTQGSV